MLADRLAEATVRHAAEDGGVADIHVIELRDHAHDLVNDLLIGYPSEALRPVLDRVIRADALIVVTPTFAASYSALFKMFVDVLEEGALAGKPVLIAATGGTSRHALVLEHALRPLFSYLRAATVATGVFAAPEDWGFGTTAEGALPHRIDRAARELTQEMSSGGSQVVRDPFQQVTPFERLLAGPAG
jgi:FMN reductase